MYGSRRLLCTQTDEDDAKKKTATYKEQDPAKVTHYLTQPAEFSDYQRVYLDETGFDRYLFRPYARSLKGQIVKAQISGKRYRRLSPVSAQVGNRLIAPMVYQNTMTGVFFEAWFQQCLLPALTQKPVIILDNARFHRMGVLREMAENRDIRYCLLHLIRLSSTRLGRCERILSGICEPYCLITPDLTMRYCPILILIDYKER